MRCKLALLWVLLVPASLSAETPKEMLRRVPGDAAAAVVVPDLQRLDRASTELAKKLGMSQVRHPSRRIKALVGMSEGIDDGRGAALVVRGIGMRAGDFRLSFLLPVADYKAFLGNFQKRKELDGKITGVSLPTEAGERGFVKRTGEYAFLGEKREAVEAYTPGDGWSLKGELERSAVEEADAFLAVDMRNVGPFVRAVARQAINRAKRRASRKRPKRLRQTTARLFGNAANRLARDTRSAVVALDVGETAIAATLAARFAPASELGAAFIDGAEEPPTLGRLPDRPTLLAVAADVSALPTKRWGRALAEALPEASSIRRLLDAGGRLATALGGRVQHAWYAASAVEGAAGTFPTATFFETEDAEAARKRIRGVVERLGQGGYETTYEAGATEVEGQRADRFRIAPQFSAEAMQRMGVRGHVLSRGTEGYLATMADGVVVTTGPKKLLASVLGKGETIGDHPDVVEARKSLLSHRWAEAYVGVRPLLRTGKRLLALFTPASTFSVPDTLPPIALGASAHDGGVSIRGRVPVEVIATLKRIVGGLAPPKGTHRDPKQPS